MKDDHLYLEHIREAIDKIVTGDPVLTPVLMLDKYPPCAPGADMEYRMATEAELPQLARMRWDFLGEGGEEVPAVSQSHFMKSCMEFLAQGLAEGDWTYWIAEHQGEIVSHIFVRTIRSVPRPCSLNDRWGYMTNVYTKPACRNNGIGTELMGHVKRWATEQDLELLIVSPSEESRTFYKRAGFAPETDFIQLRLRQY